jgi:hypothetical protein
LHELHRSVKTASHVRATLTAASLAFAISAYGQQAKECSAAEATKHIGERPTVTDKVANFGARYLNQLFTAYMPKASADRFSNANKLNGRNRVDHG